MAAFDATTAARFIAEAHLRGDAFCNLPDEIGPATVEEAYAAQEALRALWEPALGPMVGLKIATTTKVMQALMGIDHPCGGMIYRKRVHQSPARIALSSFQNLMIECEMAVRIGRDLPARAEPYTAATVRNAVAAVMPAFELIEDRRAVYKETRALSLIADNAWNGGIVLGPETPVAAGVELNGVFGRLAVDGAERAEGRTDDPMGALAWVANLAASRGRPMTAGMVVITGSLIATMSIKSGETFRFEIAGFGATEMSAT